MIRTYKAYFVTCNTGPIDSVAKMRFKVLCSKGVGGSSTGKELIIIIIIDFKKTV